MHTTLIYIVASGAASTENDFLPANQRCNPKREYCMLTNEWMHDIHCTEAVLKSYKCSDLAAQPKKRQRETMLAFVYSRMDFVELIFSIQVYKSPDTTTTEDASYYSVGAIYFV